MTAGLFAIASSALLDVTVPGTPKGAARPRAFAMGGHARMHMPDHHVNAEHFAMSCFRAAWCGADPLDEAVTLELDIIVQRPVSKATRKYPTGRIPCLSKPDADNVAKLQMDALVKAGVLRDDTRVCRLVVTKMYAAISPAEQPHVRVCVSRWSEV